MSHDHSTNAKRRMTPAPRAFSFAQLSLAARLGCAAALVALIWCVLLLVLR